MFFDEIRYNLRDQGTITAAPSIGIILYRHERLVGLIQRKHGHLGS